MPVKQEEVIKTATYVAITDGGNKVTCNFAIGDGVITLTIAGKNISAAMAQVAVRGVADVLDKSYPEATGSEENRGEIGRLHQQLDQRIDSLGFGGYLKSSLNRRGFLYLGEVVSLDENTILKIKNLGRSSARELWEFLHSHNLSYKMDTLGWVNPEKRAKEAPTQNEEGK